MTVTKMRFCGRVRWRMVDLLMETRVITTDPNSTFVLFLHLLSQLFCKLTDGLHIHHLHLTFQHHTYLLIMKLNSIYFLSTYVISASSCLCQSCCPVWKSSSIHYLHFCAIIPNPPHFPIASLFITTILIQCNPRNTQKSPFLFCLS
jgi:hypothetical protein